MHNPQKINNKLHMSRYWIPSIALILSLVIMMSSTAFGGAFLTEDGTAVPSVDADGNPYIVLNGERYVVFNRARSDSATYTDAW
ncbi:MAG: hypothetical protein R6U68_14540, partial [Desulfobacteraceae bacterium]